MLPCSWRSVVWTMGLVFWPGCKPPYPIVVVETAKARKLSNSAPVEDSDCDDVAKLSSITLTAASQFCAGNCVLKSVGSALNQRLKVHVHVALVSDEPLHEPV